VYVVDVFGQLSGFRESRRTWRTAVLVTGFAFAAVIAHFFSQNLLSGRGPR
jgi:hypothetical protein